MDNLIVLFERNKNMELDQRQRPKRFIMSKEKKTERNEQSTYNFYRKKKIYQSQI